MERVEADPVDQFGGLRDVPDGEVARLAGFQRTDLVLEPERVRGVDRQPAQCFRDGQLEQRRRHVEHQQRRGDRRGAGIAVGRDRDADAVRAEMRDGGQHRLAHEIIGAGQQHRDGARRRHGDGIGFVGMFQMIRRQRAVRGCEAGAVERGELLGVELDRQSRGARGGEHAVGLRGREADAFAKGVDRVGKPDRGGDHGVAHQIDIGVGAAGIVGWQSVRAQQCGRDPHVSHLAEAARRAQHLEFVGDGQPVARLDLDGGDSLGDQRVEPRQRARDQRILVRVACRAHRRDDPATGACDRLIGSTFEPHRPFARSVAGVDEMGVAVDQPRRDPAAGAVDRLGGIEGRRIGNGAREQDAAILRGYDAIFDEAESVARHRRKAGKLPQRVAGEGRRHAVTQKHGGRPLSSRTIPEVQ